MKTKWLAIGIILLFVGVIIAPTINFNTVKASQQNKIKERITTHEHKQIAKLESVLKSLKEKKGIPVCYFPVAVLIFIWFFIAGIELFLEGKFHGFQDFSYMLIFSFLIGFSWPISIPLGVILIIVGFILFITHWSPYKSLDTWLARMFIQA